MPNWCSNCLHIEGPGSEEFLTMAQGILEQEKSIIETLLPLPANTYKTITDSEGRSIEVYAENGYNNTINAWGTKWADSGGQLSNGIFTFESPWAPPLIAIERISKLYPSIKFSIGYHEPGMEFAGVNVYQNGECLWENDLDFEQLEGKPTGDSTEEEDEKWYESSYDQVDLWIHRQIAETV